MKYWGKKGLFLLKVDKPQYSSVMYIQAFLFMYCIYQRASKLILLSSVSSDSAKGAIILED